MDICKAWHYQVVILTLANCVRRDDIAPASLSWSACFLLYHNVSADCTIFLMSCMHYHASPISYQLFSQYSTVFCESGVGSVMKLVDANGAVYVLATRVQEREEHDATVTKLKTELQSTKADNRKLEKELLETIQKKVKLSQQVEQWQVSRFLQPFLARYIRVALLLIISMVSLLKEKAIKLWSQKMDIAFLFF